MLVCLQAAYAINKEDIEVLGVPLASLAPANALAVAGLATFDPAAQSLTLAAAFQRWIQYEYAAAGGDAPG